MKLMFLISIQRIYHPKLKLKLIKVGMFPDLSFYSSAKTFSQAWIKIKWSLEPENQTKRDPSMFRALPVKREENLSVL